LDEKLKSLYNEQKNARARVPYKSEQDIEREIDRLQKQVDTGTMKLVDEKKALADISSLHRAKKSFVGFAQQQKTIDDLKAQIADLKKSGDNPEVKALNDRYDEIQKQLDQIKKEGDEKRESFGNLRDERQKAYQEQSEAWDRIREIKDKYHQARRAYRDYAAELGKQRREKQQAERQAYEAGKRKEIAQRKLEEASAPAYGEEIMTAENLIRHFDPSAAPAKEGPAASKFAAAASRTVDDSEFKGMKLVKKEEEEYFASSGGKKKKGKKTAATSSSSDKFHLSVDVIEQLARIGVDPPTSQSYVPIVITKLKEKLEFWRGDQKRKTEEVWL
jgi:chromosome segregation ATPase